MTILAAVNAAAETVTPGITNEFLLFILAAATILFGANGIVGLVQKFNERRKDKQGGDIEAKRLNFEIDQFGIETVQKAVIRLDAEVAAKTVEINSLRAVNKLLGEKLDAMLRYIRKCVSVRRQNGDTIVRVDDVDRNIIPEVVSITE